MCLLGSSRFSYRTSKDVLENLDNPKRHVKAPIPKLGILVLLLRTHTRARVRTHTRGAWCWDRGGERKPPPRIHDVQEWPWLQFWDVAVGVDDR